MLAYGALGVALTAIPWSRWQLAVPLWTADLPADAVLEMRPAASPATGAWIESGDQRPRGDGGHLFMAALRPSPRRPEG
jgi:hypothetical protein